MSPSINHNAAERHPRWLSIIIMLAILAGSIGTAWWVSRGGDAMALRGADIIQKLREETLRPYWEMEPVTKAYLITNSKGQDLGWVISIRDFTPRGYRGTTWSRWSRGNNTLYEEDWEVRADASGGEYEARSLLPGGYQPVSIRLAYDHVTVRIGGRRTGTPARAQAPSNYIPQGTLDVVVRLAAKLNHKLTFKTILNEKPFYDRRVHFTSVTITPKPPASVVMEVDQHVKVYHLDTHGRIDRIEHPHTGTVYTATSLKKLMGKFWDVRRLVAGWM